MSINLSTVKVQNWDKNHNSYLCFHYWFL
jgi:hypothetical protein